MKTKLHHFAYNITPNSLEIVLELLAKFKCEINYREGDARWCLVKQKPDFVGIQLIETEEKPIPADIKINTHICFISDNPEKEILNIKKWCQKKKIKFKQGSWSDKELWFDLPDLFSNFVIEIMNTSIFK